jgi:hypothetical protein
MLVYGTLGVSALLLTGWEIRRRSRKKHDDDVSAYWDQLGDAFRKATWPDCQTESIDQVVKTIQGAPPTLTYLQMQLRPELDHVEAAMDRCRWTAGVVELRPDERTIKSAMMALQLKWELVRRNRYYQVRASRAA